ncbi:MAG: NAD(+) diphosphatase [Anaerolineales bacterium]|nr:NAD(+) diphosphatase [Anaerolineales bacterium]
MTHSTPVALDGLNCFTTFDLDRNPEHWRDSDWVTARLADSTTRIAPLWQLKSLFGRDGEPHAWRPLLLPPDVLNGLLERAEALVALGESRGTAYFAAGFGYDASEPPTALAALGRFEELRALSAVLDPWEGALLAYARGMVYWHRRNRFCGDCGSATVSAEGGHMRVCANPACGQQHFPRSDPAVIVRIASGERILLARQGRWPARMYSIVAGFVEPGESLEAAVVREVLEETGIVLDEVRYHSSQPWPFPSSLMLGFTARAASEVICLGDGELEDARWFSREDVARGLKAGTLSLPGPVSVSYRLIREWFEAGGLGPLSISG